MSQSPPDTELHYPFGTKCPSCSYPLHDSSNAICSECGSIIDHLALPGDSIELSDELRVYAQRLSVLKGQSFALVLPSPRIPDLITRPIFGGFVVFVLVLIVYSERRWNYMYDYAELAGILLGTIALATLSQLIWYSARSIKYRRKQNRLIQEDLDRGRVERVNYQVTRAIWISTNTNYSLLLRLSLNGMNWVLLVPHQSLEDLKITPLQDLGSNIKVSYLPICHYVVAINFEGASVQTRVSDSISLLSIANLYTIPLSAADEYSFLPKRKTKGSYFTSDS